MTSGTKEYLSYAHACAELREQNRLAEEAARKRGYEVHPRIKAANLR